MLTLTSVFGIGGLRHFLFLSREILKDLVKTFKKFGIREEAFDGHVHIVRLGQDIDERLSDKVVHEVVVFGALSERLDPLLDDDVIVKVERRHGQQTVVVFVLDRRLRL